MGVGDFRVHTGLKLVGGPLVGKNVTNVACGDSFTICSTSDNLVFSWGCSKNGRLGLEPSIGNDGNVCLPKTIFGSLHLVSEMSARHWNSIIIAEQMLDTKPVKIQSYADYMRKTTSYDATSESIESARPINEVYNYISGSEEKEDNALSPEQFVQFNIDSNYPIKEKNFSRENSDTEVPEWLKKDLEDADFIPIEAYERNEPVAHMKKVLAEPAVESKSMNIRDLDEALRVISQLEIDNLKLKEENSRVIDHF